VLPRVLRDKMIWVEGSKLADPRSVTQGRDPGQFGQTYAPHFTKARLKWWAIETPSFLAVAIA
jgi:hypothetical protein